jgi:predicted O-linked N-acetylglucosamine transferase (SPINDLY family)
MELAAHSETEFVEVATTLADDPDRLRHYRQTLRPALRESSLLDASLHVTELEDAFRVMWRRWCDGLEPEAFAGFDKSDP